MGSVGGVGMFRISEKSMEAFREAALRDFRRRAREYLEPRFPEAEAVRSDVNLRSFLDRCIVAGKGYELESELAVIRFAHLLLLVGEGFADDARWEWLVPHLRDERVVPNARARLALVLAVQALSES
jgi:hypothetical protein